MRRKLLLAAMGLQIQVLHASTSREINTAFATLRRERPDALFVGGDGFFVSRRVQLAHLASRHALPAAYADRQFPEIGGLMSYGSNNADAYRHAGFYAGRILKGASPADLPVVQASKFELVINAETARMLGLDSAADAARARRRGNRMRRREFITLLGGAAAAWPLAARAQQPTRKMPRIGWLVTGSPELYRFSLAAFREGLRALNYIEGKNIIIEYRWARGDVGRLHELAKELVEQKVDIIVAGGSIGARVAKEATLVIPIVAAGAGEGLVEWGLVESLANPRSNVTGFMATFAKTASKRIQIMKEVFPNAKRAAILWNENPWELQEVKESEAPLQLAFNFYQVGSVADLEAALSAIANLNPDMLVVLNDPFMFTHRKRVAAAASEARVPAVYGFREFVDDGGLISYGPNISDTYRRAASYVDKILKGANPAELPVQLPTKFELVINLKTSRALGLEVPPTLLGRADEVIE